MPNHAGVDAFAAVIAALLGLLGRLMSMAQERRNPFGRSLLWELPAAIGLGFVGRGVGEYLGAKGFALMSCSVVVAYMGPRVLSWAVTQALKIEVKR